MAGRGKRFMFNYVWPLVLLVLSNTFYQLCAKSVPSGMHPMASLVITYGVGLVTALILYFVMNRGGSLLTEFHKANWASFVLGIAIVGLEVGFIYAYRAGWQVSVLQIVQAVILAVVLIVIGYFAYHEQLTWKKLVGMAVCLGGLYLINAK